jgi:predicted TIM-barrel fold metal-dependent hydrolase
MAREGYFILDSDLHLMEPHDLWERYLEGAHKANPPHFFAAHRRPEEEIKVVGMEVQGLAIPAHGRSLGAIASSRELRRRSRARHPHFEIAQAQGFDAASTLTAMDIEGIDVAVMYGTRGRQVLSHDNLPPDYAAALARAYNNWTHDYCAHDPTRLKFAAKW